MRRQGYAGWMAARGGVILYETTAAGIRARIEAGELVPDDQVGPSLKVMATQHGVSVATMREALKLLASEGLVQTIQGKGTFVTGRPAASDIASQAALEALAGAVTDLRGRGR